MEVKMLGGGQQLELSEGTFGRDFNEALVHQVVVAYLSTARAGTKAQKTRSQISGGGHKPYRQKGTGRARAGSTRSPLWRGGGTVFAARPQDWSQKVNRKMYRGAMRSILSELLRQERLLFTDSFEVPDHKTRTLVTRLRELELPRVLIVTESFDEKLYLAARNLYKVEVCQPGTSGFNPVNLVNYEKVLMTAGAARKVEELLK